MSRDWFAFLEEEFPFNPHLPVVEAIPPSPWGVGSADKSEMDKAFFKGEVLSCERQVGKHPHLTLRLHLGENIIRRKEILPKKGRFPST